MNFKPTLWKVIISIITFFIVSIIFAIFVSQGCVGGIGKECSAPIQLSAVFSLIFQIPFGYVGLVIVYVLWSLIQKK